MAAALGLVAVSAPRATACVCINFPTFDQAMVAAKSVLVGRVVAQGRPAVPRMYPDLDVAYVDVDVVAVVKGKESRSRVRVWDLSHGTDCAADLGGLTPGTVFAVAGWANRGEYRDYLAHAVIKPAFDDYLFGGCGTQFERLRVESDADRLSERLKKAAAQQHK